MEQYILKSALVAEINQRIEDYKSHKIDDSYHDGLIFALEDLRDNFIDTLEVKEIDTEQLNKLLNWWKGVTTDYSAYKVKEVDEQKERMSECPYKQVGCKMYEGKILECNGACSWVVDYQKSKELKAQKGDNMTKEIEEIKECDGKISSNIVTVENNWYVCIKQLNNFEVGKVYCIGKNSVIAVPEYFRLATDEEISQGASMQNTDTTEPTGVRLEKCPKA